MSAKQKILVISGITGIGKSDLALKIAKLLKTDIIVGDSLQVYLIRNFFIFILLFRFIRTFLLQVIFLSLIIRNQAQNIIFWVNLMS